MKDLLTRYQFGLLIGTAISIGCMFILFVLGERTLPLFGGDRVLAARTYKALFLLLSGLSLATASPALVVLFVGRLQRLFRSAGSQGWIADLILGPSAMKMANLVGLALLAFFLIAGLSAAAWVWTRE